MFIIKKERIKNGEKNIEVRLYKNISNKKKVFKFSVRTFEVLYNDNVEGAFPLIKYHKNFKQENEANEYYDDIINVFKED